MKFEELYNLVLENEQVVVEEGFFNKLKIFAIGALLGFPAIDFEYQRYKQEVAEKLKENPEQIEQVYQSANDMAREISKTLSPEVKNQIAKADPDTSMRIIQQAVEEKPFDKKQVVPVQPKKQAEVLSGIKEYIKFHEISNQGIRNNSYADSKGYSTIGIGHLILKNEVGPGKLFTPDEISYQKVDGETRRVITISDKKALEIFENDFKNKVATASSKYNFPSLFKYPEKLQIAILDAFFRGDLSSRKRAGQSEARANIRTAMTLFFKYDEALKKGQSLEAQKLLEKGKRYLDIAADNYLKHPDYHDRKKDGVDKRMLENANLIRSAFDEYSVQKQQIGPETTPNF